MKKAFTLIEIIVIVWILAILLSTTSFLWSKNESEKIRYWKECSNYIFQEIINEHNNIEKNKIINFSTIGWVKIEKEEANGYWLVVNIFNESWVSISNKKLINTNWSCTAEHISNKKNYIINTDKEFLIGIWKNDNFANEIIKVCENWEPNCIEISKINYHKTINKFKLKFCILTNEDWNCKQWEE